MLDLRKVLLLSSVFLLTTISIFAQDEKNRKTDIYVTGGLEVILSGNTGLKIDGQELNNGVVRFAPVFNWQSLVNFDFSPHFGLYTGLGVRNVGMIFDVPNEYKDPELSGPVRKKVRTYNLGIPVGFKVGNLHGMFVYGGYEFELPIQYKEKTFVSERKIDKFSVWFSDRVDVQHSLMLGIQFPYGTNLKMKYYLNNYFSSSWDKDKGGMYGTIDPNEPGRRMSYNQMTGNVFYVSLNFSLFRNTKFYYSEYEKKHTFPES
ncbi:outer membrane beta-barrel protein [Flammeovirga sp. OC4]|uniref:outer membrane beta-barrel protein n=1 Tax=Flammeovirga sp. OC4 TaxID=1382345 RepID=UPI0005C43B2D|nr:outer membrane beta-barrel protein [Flammeovirga sp. OC4]